MLRNSIAQLQRGARLSYSVRVQHYFARSLHSTFPRQEQYHNANKETFESVVQNGATNDKVVLVDFYADWCQPCKMISPILERLASDAKVKTGSGKSLDLVTVNTDEEFDLVERYRIRSLPTVIAFKDGQSANQFIGALNEAGIKKFLETI